MISSPLAPMAGRSTAAYQGGTRHHTIAGSLAEILEARRMAAARAGRQAPLQVH